MIQKSITGKRCTAGGFFSSKDNEHLQKMELTIKGIQELGAIHSGTILQRRGVSRSSKPGGSKVMDQPMNTKFLFSKGKLEELKTLTESEKTEIVVIFNPLTQNQKQSLSRLLDLPVLSYSDDLCVSTQSTK
ncbi:hypothetical protein [Pelagicoccus sp. SDUM812002]|uniref:HflX-like GTP-binding protein n=1 Tax=Pelagicoccus sp. SDUM812002 TaxID=3041266 RepID=UPI00280C8424|nr:hypothetical protein [Pelagicoccus sp. SDUM812002]MDQ8188542.1 hypothetical protein [Pelagicoccus sp. SDUM812002]